MKINLKELKKAKEDNFRDRLKFVDFWAEYVLKTPNKKWSSEQKEFIDALFKTAKNEEN